MYNDIKTLKKVSKKISGLKIIFKDLQPSELSHNTKKGAYINLNLKQLDDIPTSYRKIRKHNVKYFYFMVLLHEIAHYKKLCKFRTVRHYLSWQYGGNYDYNEKIADRYAIRYYKRFVKNEKVS